GGRSSLTRARRVTCSPLTASDIASRTHPNEPRSRRRPMVRWWTPVDAFGQPSTTLVAGGRAVATDAAAVDALSRPVRPTPPVSFLRVHGLRHPGQHCELPIWSRDRC